MRLLLISLVLVGYSLAYQAEWLSAKRISPEKAINELGDTCTDCKTAVHRIVEALDDPKKVEELKVLLAFLCHETSYEKECKMFVDNLDKIIKKIEPYLRDEEAVCKKLHLCGTANVTSADRMMIRNLKNAVDRMDAKESTETFSFTCLGCQIDVFLVRIIYSFDETRAMVKEELYKEVCMPIKWKWAQKGCGVALDIVLPLFWVELDALLADPKKACVEMKYCDKRAAFSHNKLAILYKNFLEKDQMRSSNDIPEDMKAEVFGKVANFINGTMDRVDVKDSSNGRFQCYACRFTVWIAKMYLKDPTRRAKFTAEVIADTCKKHPEIDNCEKAVGNFMEDFWNWWDAVDTKQACWAFGRFCPVEAGFSKNNFADFHKNHVKKDEIPSSDGIPNEVKAAVFEQAATFIQGSQERVNTKDSDNGFFKCKVCQLTVLGWRWFLKDPTRRAQITEEAVEDFCKKHPEVENCKETMENFYSDFWAWWDAISTKEACWWFGGYCPAEAGFSRNKFEQFYKSPEKY